MLAECSRFLFSSFTEQLPCPFVDDTNVEETCRVEAREDVPETGCDLV